MEGQRALGFHQKYLNLYVILNESLRFEATWGWVINDWIFILRWTIPLKDTADDAGEGPEADAQPRPEHGFAVDVRLHEVRQQRLDQDVQSTHAERQDGAHHMHREQSGFLGKTRHTLKVRSEDSVQ